jgi:hypothetical protein
MIPKTTTIPSTFHDFDPRKGILVITTHNFKVPPGQLKINTFEPANPNISFTEENMPTLHAHLGNSIQINA